MVKKYMKKYEITLLFVVISLLLVVPAVSLRWMPELIVEDSVVDG